MKKIVAILFPFLMFMSSCDTTDSNSSEMDIGDKVVSVGDGINISYSDDFK